MSTHHGGAVSAIKQLVIGALAVCALVVGIQTVTTAPAQAAQSDGYYGRQCVVPALTGDGLAGNGCDVLGVARWIPNTSGNPEIPKWVMGCVQGGKWAVLLLPFSKAGPQGLVGTALIGCATGAADSLISG